MKAVGLSPRCSCRHLSSCTGRPFLNIYFVIFQAALHSFTHLPVLRCSECSDVRSSQCVRRAFGHVFPALLLQAPSQALGSGTTALSLSPSQAGCHELSCFGGLSQACPVGKLLGCSVQPTSALKSSCTSPRSSHQGHLPSVSKFSCFPEVLPHPRLHCS